VRRTADKQEEISGKKLPRLTNIFRPGGMLGGRLKLKKKKPGGSSSRLFGFSTIKKFTSASRKTASAAAALF
jgi:hypothetical protein